MFRGKIFGITSFVSFILMLYLFLTYKTVLMQAIQDSAIVLRHTPGSSIILSLIIIVTSIPPMPLFIFFNTVTGFIYGFPGGLLPAITGAFMGAMTAFYLIRKFNITRFIQFSTSTQDKYMAIQEALDEGGFKMMLLIKLSPIPWPMTNLLLSVIPNVKTSQFIGVSALASFKVILEVWIGSQLADLSNADVPESTRRITVITMVCGVLILIIVGWWLYRLTMEKVNEITFRRHNQLGVTVAQYVSSDLQEIVTIVDEDPALYQTKKAL
ncbi:hypothetical protein BDB01DRAFT_790398 [Pilobolus umbonatus]|nr:hypothetical protein BDB01DRAFT_790398 [Pilobolus umbonatus]